MSKKSLSILTLAIALGFIIMSAAPVLALESLVPPACRGSQVGANVNDCGVSQMIEVLINVTNIILELTGAVALAVFIYGGVMWIIAAGNDERVKQGKEALKAAVIGIILILTSWLIVNFVIYALTGQGGDIGPMNIFGQHWYAEQTVSTGAENAGTPAGKTDADTAAPAKPPEPKPASGTGEKPEGSAKPTPAAPTPPAPPSPPGEEEVCCEYMTIKGCTMALNCNEESGLAPGAGSTCNAATGKCE